LDIRKYFDSIDHMRLKTLLSRRFKDPKLLDLFGKVIDSFRGQLGVGLPIGSLTSQHLANFYLAELDRYVQHHLRPVGYVRYMDDMVLWGDDRQRVKGWQDQINAFLAEDLALQLKPSSCQATRHGLSFLGCRIFPTHTLLNRRSRLRWQRRMRQLVEMSRGGILSDSELQTRLQSATAFTMSAGVKSWQYRRAVLERWQVGDQEELEPGQPGRQLEQPGLELPGGEP
jgi:RNA-directed DNA polymerase